MDMFSLATSSLLVLVGVSVMARVFSGKVSLERVAASATVKGSTVTRGSAVAEVKATEPERSQKGSPGRVAGKAMVKATLAQGVMTCQLELSIGLETRHHQQTTLSATGRQ